MNKLLPNQKAIIEELIRCTRSINEWATALLNEGSSIYQDTDKMEHHYGKIIEHNSVVRGYLLDWHKHLQHSEEKDNNNND